MKNRIVGLIVVLGAMLALGFVLRTLFHDSRPRLVFRTTSTTVLGQGDPVKFNGVKIGSIEDVVPSTEGIRLIATLEADVCVPKNAAIRVGRAGLLGEREIQVSSKGAGGECYADKDLIEIPEPEFEARNPLVEMISTPEKIDTIIAILRRLEESRSRGERK